LYVLLMNKLVPPSRTATRSFSDGGREGVRRNLVEGRDLSESGEPVKARFQPGDRIAIRASNSEKQRVDRVRSPVWQCRRSLSAPYFVSRGRRASSSRELAPVLRWRIYPQLGQSHGTRSHKIPGSTALQAAFHAAQPALQKIQSGVLGPVGPASIPDLQSFRQSAVEWPCSTQFSMHASQGLGPIGALEPVRAGATRLRWPKLPAIV